MNDFQKLYAALLKKYPNIQMDDIYRDDSGNPVIDIDTGETTLYIVQKPNGKFSVNAVWSGDEKGRQNLTAKEMVKALDGIPGISQ